MDEWDTTKRRFIHSQTSRKDCGLYGSTDRYANMKTEELDIPPAHRKQRDERGTASSYSAYIFLTALDRATCQASRNFKFPGQSRDVVAALHPRHR